jgi:hypothetical protein
MAVAQKVSLLGKNLPLLSDFSNLSATSMRMASKSLPARGAKEDRPAIFKIQIDLLSISLALAV